MRNELLGWFAREGLLLQDVVTAAEDPEHDEIKVSVKAPIIALSRAHEDFRECPDPVLFGYPESCLDMMSMDDFHQFDRLLFHFHHKRMNPCTEITIKNHRRNCDNQAESRVI